jgi:hypothetical protein
MLAAIGFAASRPRARLMAAAVSAQASALRDEMMTVAPCSANRSAIARPMPREEPVMIATRPVRSNRLVKVSSRWTARRSDDALAFAASMAMELPDSLDLCKIPRGQTPATKARVTPTEKR